MVAWRKTVGNQTASNSLRGNLRKRADDQRFAKKSPGGDVHVPGIQQQYQPTTVGDDIPGFVL